MTAASDNVFTRLLISEGGSTTTPASGNVTVYAKADGLLYSKDDAGAETALGGGGGGTTLVGRAAQAFPNGFSVSATTSATALAALSGSDAGAVAVPIAVPTTMYLEGFGLWATDTATARSAEARLYLDDGDATANFVTGTDAAFSFTPTAAALRRASVSGAPVELDPGVYWLVVRNSHATSTFGFGRQSPATILLLTMYRTKSIPALGATLDLDTSWSDGQNGAPAVWLEGRVIGRTTPL